MITVVPFSTLTGFEIPGVVVRDHFRDSPENRGRPNCRLGPMRVLADTCMEAGCGFPFHPHRDMEIVTVVCEGAVSHQDTLGNRGRIPAGGIQAMTTGTGIQHTESNLETTRCRIYQVWIEPSKTGLEPSYVDVERPGDDAAGEWRALASGIPGHAAPATIAADAAILRARFDGGRPAIYQVPTKRHTYIVAAVGAVAVNGVALGERDGARIDDEAELRFESADPGEVVIFDLPLA